MLSPYDRAAKTYGPLTTALRAYLPIGLYTIDVENTGGWVMCLFVRRRFIASDVARPDRCAVFSEDGYNEPDPTAPSIPSVGLYRDWNGEDDGVILDWSNGPRFNDDTAEAVAAAFGPLIRGWLTDPVLLHWSAIPEGGPEVIPTTLDQ